MKYGILGSIVWLLIIALSVTATLGLLDRMKRRHAAVRDGWRYLTPGPTVWFALTGSFILSGLMSYFYLFVGSARADAVSQMNILLIMAVVFNLSAIFIAYGILVEEFRWNDTWVEARDFLFRRRTLSWHALARLGYSGWGYWWIQGYDGPVLRFGASDNGVSELLRKILDSLPPDVPPGDFEALLEPALVRAGYPGCGPS